MKRFGSRKSLPAAFFVAISVATIGCGGGYDGPPRAEVSGTVNWKGEPVDGGTINFFPVTQGARTAGGTIVGGKYKIEEKLGPEMGEYKVLINWGKKVPGSEDNLDAPLVEQIPREFNMESKLTVTIDKSPQEISYDLPQ